MVNLNAVTLQQIVTKDIDKKFFNRAENCQIKHINYISSNPNRVIFWITCGELYSDPKGQYVSFVFDGYVPKNRDTKKPLNTDLRMKCTCGWWKFGGVSYNATTEGYSYNYVENRFPEVKDPDLKNKACKHIIKAYNSLKHKTFKQIKKKYVRANMDFGFPTVEVEETFQTLLKWGENNNVQIDDEFLLSINKYNFEKIMVDLNVVV